MKSLSAIKVIAFLGIFTTMSSSMNALANTAQRTEIVKVNVPNNALAERFVCRSNPVFQTYLEHDGVFDLSYARSQDKYLADAINKVLNNYVDQFIHLHNTDTDPFDPSPTSTTFDCDEAFPADTVGDVYLNPVIFYNNGSFDWREIRQKPHSNIRQFQITHEIWYGIYPKYNQTTVIVDTSRQQVIPFDQVVILSKLKSKQIQNLIRKHYQAVIENQSTYIARDEYPSSDSLDTNHRTISNLLSQMHFDNNIHLLNNGVVFWFTGNAGSVFDEQFEVFIPYEEINPALQPRFRK